MVNMAIGSDFRGGSDSEYLVNNWDILLTIKIFIRVYDYNSNVIIGTYSK